MFAVPKAWQPHKWTVYRAKSLTAMSHKTWSVDLSFFQSIWSSSEFKRNWSIYVVDFSARQHLVLCHQKVRMSHTLCNYAKGAGA